MKYCSNCGHEVHENDKFCKNCSSTLGEANHQQGSRHGDYNHHHRIKPIHVAPILVDPVHVEPIHITASVTVSKNHFYALAYIPPLFWLPMVFCTDNKNTRKCANQGLWLLILSFIITNAVLAMLFNALGSQMDVGSVLSLPYDWMGHRSGLRSALFNFDRFGLSSASVAVKTVFCTLFTAIVSFIPINTIIGGIRGFKGSKLHTVPIFRRIKLIKDKPNIEN